MKRTINKPKKKSHKKKLEIKKNSKPLNKTKKDERNYSFLSPLLSYIFIIYNNLLTVIILA